MALSSKMTTPPWLKELMVLPILVATMRWPIKVIVCSSVFHIPYYLTSFMISLYQRLLLTICVFDVHLQPEEEVELNRGPNMGHGLQRLNRARRGKLRVIITAGHQRPLVPLVAAKFATECKIIVRNHIPVFTHWKEYKRDSQWFTSFCKYLQVS